MVNSAMSVATELNSPGKLRTGNRRILAPAGNGVRVPEESKSKKEEGGLKKPQKPKMSNSETPAAVVVRTNNNINVSVDSSCSSDSCGSVVASSAKKIERREKRIAATKGLKPKSGNVSTDSVEAAASLSPFISVPLKRCDWITPYSDSVYTSFHDEEWGVPVHDDTKLFELFVLSLALAELTWPAILYKREAFRKLFHNFIPSSIAKFTEKELLSLRENCNTMLSEPKLRAVVENAKQLLKVQEEFGSFSNYIWRFVNHKPIRNGFRYARQVPAKTPKSELISRDLMRRGFRCVGPTVIYSFMQVAGMVNDHLMTCFRNHDCDNGFQNDLKPKLVETKEPAAEGLEITSQSS